MMHTLQRLTPPPVLVASVLIAALALACEKGMDSETGAVAIGASADPQANQAPESQRAANRASNYSARVQESRLSTEPEQTLALIVRPGRGLKINEDFPWKFDFDAVEGLGMPATTLAGDQIKLEEMQALIPVSLGEVTPGTYKVEATGNFSVCNDDRCDILRNERMEFEIEVAPRD